MSRIAPATVLSRSPAPGRSACYSLRQTRSHALAASTAEMPARRTSLTNRSRSVPNARSTRPFACGRLAQRMSMFGSLRARPNCVAPSPPAASLAFTRKCCACRCRTQSACHASPDSCASRGNNRMFIPRRQIEDASIGLSRCRQTRAVCTWLTPGGQTMVAIDPQTRRDHPAAQRFTRDRAAVYFRRLLRRQCRTKISLLFAHQRQRQITIRLRQTVIARPAPSLQTEQLASVRDTQTARLNAQQDLEPVELLQCSSIPPASRPPEAPPTLGGATSTLQRGVISILRLHSVSSPDRDVSDSRI